MGKFRLTRKEFFHGLTMSATIIFVNLVITPMFRDRATNWEIFVSDPWRLLAMVLTWLIGGCVLGFIYKISPENYKRPRY